MTRELSDEARSVIRHAVAAERQPGRAHRDRLRRGVLARAAAGGVVTLVGSSVAKASGHALLSAMAGSLGLGFGAGLVLAGAAQFAFRPSAPAVPNERGVAASAARHVPQKAVVRGASEPASTLAPSLPTSDPVAAPAAPLSAPEASVRAVSHPNAAPAPSSPLRAELDLMAQVQEALRDNQGARALELIARYDAQYPSGMLETERLAAEVFAACQAGEPARARRVARRFLLRDNGSALAERVKKACSGANSEWR